MILTISSPALGSTAALADQIGLTGTGTYMLTGAGDHVRQSGQSCLQLTLEDAQGRVTGFVWPEFRPYVSGLAAPIPVLVTGCVQHYKGQPQLKVQALTPLMLEQAISATALLPLRHCPEAAWSALERLEQLERELPYPLDAFLRRVLLDPAIGLPLLRCRASVRHHHAYVGGLLVHSTNMLDLANELTCRIIPNDHWSPFLAQLGYLLHDLGKLRTVGELRRPQYALAVPHEFATIELLAPHLRWLEQRDLALAVALRHLFSFLAIPARARTTPNHVVAEVVEKLDQLSAATHNQRDLAHLLEPPRRTTSSALRQGRMDPASPMLRSLPAAG
jgi:3'-5' exoribonuclease